MTTIATLSPLSSPEERKLKQYEETIEKYSLAYFEVGTALAAIRDGQLYRSTDATFEGYCRRRWQFSASRARQLIGSVEAVKNVESVTTVTPDNERQARVLASIDTPEHQADVWAKAVATAPKDKDGEPKVTAAYVQKVANEMFGEPKEPEDDPDDPTDISEPTKPAEPPPIFAHLASLPDDMAEAFEAFKLSILRHKISGWTEISRPDVIDALDKLKQLALAPSE